MEIFSSLLGFYHKLPKRKIDCYPLRDFWKPKSHHDGHYTPAVQGFLDSNMNIDNWKNGISNLVKSRIRELSDAFKIIIPRTIEDVRVT
jgi:hypothetical protein